MDKDFLADMNASSGKWSRQVAGLLKCRQRWDLREIEKTISICEAIMTDLPTQWTASRSQVVEFVQETRALIMASEYGPELEKALSDAGISLHGSFPTYEFPPFRLTIDAAGREAKLQMGRRVRRITTLQPKELAGLVARDYLKVTSKKLDVKRFLQDLLSAYQISNRLVFGEKDVLWGHAVPLEKIYDLFTLRRASRQDYPKELFQFDMGRVKEQFDLTLDEYRFEMGFARNQAKAMVIVDSQGREHYISSLTIYKEGTAK